MVWEPEMQEFARRRELAHRQGGEQRVADQHGRGKLTVRERVEALLDPGSFRERGELSGTGAYDEQGELAEFYPASYVMGLGRIDGRRVVVGGGDLTARPPSGSAGVRTYSGRAASKGGADEAMALDLKLPMIRLIDGFGADIRATEGMGRTYIPELRGFPTEAALLSEVPVVSAALGAVAGLPAAQVAFAHYAVMVKEISQVFAAGPPVVARGLGMEVTKEQLGGVTVHAYKSGLVDYVAEDEADAFANIRRFLSYLPSNVYQLPPVAPCVDPTDRREEALGSIIPRERNRPHDVRKMVALIADQGSVFEIGRFFGRSQVTMLARLGGRPVGVLANDPLHLGGSMDADAAQKLESFIDFCDTFHLPIVNFVDQPGFMIGPAAESAGTLRHGARALCAMDACTIPWAAVIVRKVYGVAGAGHQPYNRFVYRLAWPSSEWGSIPIEGGVMAAYRREIEAADDPDQKRAEIEAMLIQRRKPFGAVEAFNAEEMIDTRDTRPVLCDWVELAYETLLPQDVGRKLRPLRP
ncbi:MAG: methylmalonyl-CoA carboxyltransferase [Chloroflexi bacterium]|nr:methylmalonyl-CoA carboxyltransferase [Chloroflexota bacterium]MDA1061713.1 methylmalonyl-CoA carboxyltransferase [Chloroflexota bacterium]